MIRQDYLLRLIEQLGEFIRRATGTETADSTEALDQHLEELTGEILGLPTSMILTTPPEDLISLFELSDRMVIEKCYLTAEIHRLRAQIEKDPDIREMLNDRATFFFSTIVNDLTGSLRDQANRYLNDQKA